VAVVIFTFSFLFLADAPIIFSCLQVKMSSSASSSEGLSGEAVGRSGGAGSVSALFESSESGTSLRGVSNATSSPILLSGSSEAELPVMEAAEQVATSEESGDIIGIDVDDEGDATDLPEISGYDWAPYEPRTLATRFRWGNDLGDLVERTRIFSEEVEDRHLRVKICAGNERVCHGKGEARLDFFYVYACLFQDLGLNVPFTDWQMAVLRQIQCAPTQIHPNAWASMQAFDDLCRAAGLTPTMPLFLHFYKTRPTASKGWVSFLGANKSLLTLYLASYKGFKTAFFKVAIPLKGRRYIFDEQDRPKFPLYWTTFPPPTDAWPEERLTPAERADLAVLKTLPDKIPPWPLIQCLRSPDLPGAVYG